MVNKDEGESWKSREKVSEINRWERGREKEKEQVKVGEADKKAEGETEVFKLLNTRAKFIAQCLRFEI